MKTVVFLERLLLMSQLFLAFCTAVNTADSDREPIAAKALKERHSRNAQGGADEEIGTVTTCTYNCNEDGSCEHETLHQITTRSGLYTQKRTENQRGTCVSPSFTCMGGICCAGVSEECGECRDICKVGSSGQLVKVDGRTTSNSLTGANVDAPRIDQTVPKNCCQVVMVSATIGFENHKAVASINSQLGKYTIDQDGLVDGKASWTGENSAYSLWYSAEGSRWLLGTTSGKGSLGGWIYAKSESDCVNDQVSPWNYYHDSEWQLDNNRAITISCFQNVTNNGVLAPDSIGGDYEEAPPYLTITTVDNKPLEWGGPAIGLYQVLPMTFNSFPVYQHEYFKMYLFANPYTGNLCVGTDLTKDECYLTIANLSSGSPNITAWNEKAGIWDYPSHPVKIYQQLPPESSLPQAPPCILSISSEGPIGQKYPEKMGLYYLVPNFSLYGRPVWKKNDESYLRMDDEATWIISKCQQNCSLAYFGGMSYRGISLPHLLDTIWVHYGDVETDIHQDNQYLEDSLLKVNDVCSQFSCDSGPQGSFSNFTSPKGESVNVDGKTGFTLDGIDTKLNKITKLVEKPKSSSSCAAKPSVEIKPQVGSVERYTDGQSFNQQVKANTTMDPRKREVLRDASFSLDNIKRYKDKLTQDQINVVYQAESLVFKIAYYYDELATRPALTLGQTLQETELSQTRRRRKRQTSRQCCDRVVVHYKTKLDDLQQVENFYGLFSKIGEVNSHYLYQSHCTVSQGNTGAENRKFELYFCQGIGWMLGLEGSGKNSAEGKGCGGFADNEQSLDNQCVADIKVNTWNMLNQKKKAQGITEYYPALDGLLIKCVTGTDKTRRLDDSDCDRDFSAEALEEDAPTTEPKAENPKCQGGMEEACCNQIKVFYAGENSEYGSEPIEGGYGYGLYTKAERKVNGRSLYVHETGGRYLWWNELSRTWVIGYEEKLGTSTGIVNSWKDTSCPSNIGFDWLVFKDGKWSEAGDKYGVKCEENDPDQDGDTPRALKSYVTDLTDKLHAASTFLESGKERLKCAPNVHNQLREVGQIVANLKKIMSSRSAAYARFKRDQFLPTLRDFYIDSFQNIAFDSEGRFNVDCQQSPTASQCKDWKAGSAVHMLGETSSWSKELQRLCAKGYKNPSKECLLEWGAQYVNNLDEDHYITLLTGMKNPEDCMEPCRSNPACNAWTFNKQEGYCYLKRKDMATRFSDSWNSQVWSGRMDTCNHFTRWHRVCDSKKYFKCIEDIMDTFNIKSRVPDSNNRWRKIYLNNIRNEDRYRYDTLDEELNCMVDFCPWTPNNFDEVLKNEIELSLNFQNGFMEKQMCKPDSKEAKECKVSLEDILQRYQEVDPNQAFLNAFEEQVMEKLSPVERVSVIFYLKELTIDELIKTNTLEVGMYDGKTVDDDSLPRTKRQAATHDEEQRQRRQTGQDGDDQVDLEGGQGPNKGFTKDQVTSAREENDPELGKGSQRPGFTKDQVQSAHEENDPELGKGKNPGFTKDQIKSSQDAMTGITAPKLEVDGQQLTNPFLDPKKLPDQRFRFEHGKWIDDKWGFKQNVVFMPTDKRSGINDEKALVVHTKDSEKQMLIMQHSGHDKQSGSSSFATFNQDEADKLAKTVLPSVKKQETKTLFLLGCDTCEKFAAGVKDSLKKEGHEVDVRIMDKKSLKLPNPESEKTQLWGSFDENGRMTFTNVCKKPDCQVPGVGCVDKQQCFQDLQKNSATVGVGDLMKQTRPVGKFDPSNQKVPAPSKPEPPGPVIANVQVGQTGRFGCVLGRDKNCGSSEAGGSMPGSKPRPTATGTGQTTGQGNAKSSQIRSREVNNNDGLRRIHEKVRRDNQALGMSMDKSTLRRSFRRDSFEFQPIAQTRRSVMYVNDFQKNGVSNLNKIQARETRLNAAVDLAGSIQGSLGALQSGDALTMLSGIFSLVAAVASFIPGKGTVVAIFATALSTIFQLANDSPSPEQVIMYSLNAQTRFIDKKIDEQTEIIIRWFKELATLNNKQTDRVIKEIELTDYRQLLDDMNGVTASLKVKKEHLNQYQTACINDWTEISIESDMDGVTKGMSKIASFTRRFCVSEANLFFCGALLFQYTMLAALRTQVRTATMSVVQQSRYFNQPFKAQGLAKELETELNLDRTYLEPIVTLPDPENWYNNFKKAKSPLAREKALGQYCHVVCALEGIKNKVSGDLDKFNFTNTDIGLAKREIGIMDQYFKQLGIHRGANLKRVPEDKLDYMCQECYVKNVDCCNDPEHHCDKQYRETAGSRNDKWRNIKVFRQNCNDKKAKSDCLPVCDRRTINVEFKDCDCKFQWKGESGNVWNNCKKKPAFWLSVVFAPWAAPAACGNPFGCKDIDCSSGDGFYSDEMIRCQDDTTNSICNVNQFTPSSKVDNEFGAQCVGGDKVLCSNCYPEKARACKGKN